MIISNFENALLARGATFAQITIIADGNLHRLPAIDDKQGKLSISYLLHSDFSFGFIQNFKDGKGVTLWFPDNNPEGKKFSKKSNLEIKISLEKQREELRKRHKNAVNKAEWLYKNASVAETHSYLTQKGIEPSKGLKVHNKSLLIPMYFERSLCNLQIISSYFDDGGKEHFNKVFLKGGRCKGAYHIIGKLTLETKEVIFCEGYSTGKTLYDAIERPVIVCFAANNICEVAKQFNLRFPLIRIIICADDDFRNEHNTGLMAAYETAEIINNRNIIGG